ncbi:MAG: hypothetical protein RIS26_758 [Actinomycetota bacterium]|jgi:uncharacterized membrane protein YczE
MSLKFSPNFWFRFAKLNVGLFIYGLGLALLVHARIGVPPWDVFAQGIAKQTNISFGWATVTVSAIVLICWLPLKQRYGIGTLLNGLLIGVWCDVWSNVVPETNVYWLQILEFGIGMLIVATATGMYISTNFGKGPRDGIMVGTAEVLGWPFWVVRTMFEATVLTIGFLMGGQVREGTLIFAVCIGYLMQTSMRLFGVPVKPRYQK